MPTYISLLRYTQQGIMDAKNGPARLDAAKEAFRRAGAEMKAFYLLMGPYDALAILDAPDDVTDTRIGVQELRTPDAVDAVLGKTTDSTLVVVNSVCGCAARNARPATAIAIQHAKRPRQLLTVFAGQDADATTRARSYFTGYQPSSPQIALFQDGKLVFMLERKNIEGRAAADIASDLTAAFERYCA